MVSSKNIEASLLAFNIKNTKVFYKQLKSMKTSGINIIHYDVMDNEFVPNTAFGVDYLQKLNNLSFNVNVHLMVKDAKKYLDLFLIYPFYGISFHAESQPKWKTKLLLKKIRKAGRKCGLAFKFETNIHKYEKLIKFCDYVVIMGVNPGFGGRSFDDRAIKQLEAINEIKKKKYNLSLNVKLDGGVNYDVIKKTFDYVDNFVSGTFLLKLKSPKELVNFINKIEQK